MTDSDYDLARFISFRDREACERVRAITRDRPRTTCESGASGSGSSTSTRTFYQAFADDIVGRIRPARDEARPFVGIFPVGPMPQYEIAARTINEERLSLAHVHTFNMDEYANEDGVTAPLSWPGSFQRAMWERFFDLVDADLRPPEEQIHFPTTEAIGDYSAADRGSRRRRRLLRRHRLVRPHRVLGVAPRARVRRRPRGLQAGGRPPRRAAPDDDHAERAPLLRRRLVVGAAEGEHDRATRDPRRAAPQLLARRRPRRRRVLAALHRPPGRPRPRVASSSPARSCRPPRPTTRSSAASPTTSRSTWPDGSATYGARTGETCCLPRALETGWSSSGWSEPERRSPPPSSTGASRTSCSRSRPRASPRSSSRRCPACGSRTNGSPSGSAR